MNRGQWRLLVWYENFHEHEKKKDHIAPKYFFYKQASGLWRAKLSAKFVFCCAHVTKQSQPWNVQRGAPSCAAPLGKHWWAGRMAW